LKPRITLLINYYNIYIYVLSKVQDINEIVHEPKQKTGGLCSITTIPNNTETMKIHFMSLFHLLVPFNNFPLSKSFEIYIKGQEPYKVKQVVFWTFN